MNAVKAEVPLAQFCTIDVGGPARYFVAARSDREVCDAVAWARNANLPMLVLGGGSNVVIADRGFPGLVVRSPSAGLTRALTARSSIYNVGAGEVVGQLRRA